MDPGLRGCRRLPRMTPCFRVSMARRVSAPAVSAWRGRDHMPPRDIAIIGAGPAGLIAAERLAQAGHRVTIHERMASPARKFLLAGRGGLNLTHMWNGPTRKGLVEV